MGKVILSPKPKDLEEMKHEFYRRGGKTKYCKTAYNYKDFKSAPRNSRSKKPENLQETKIPTQKEVLDCGNFKRNKYIV